MKSKAFTLIELLVVIAIIALLMAILMPSLRLARDQARRVHCVSNTKNLSVGWFMYKDENDDKLVGGHTGVINGQMQWVDVPAQDATVEEKKQALRDGLLFKYVGEEVDIYHCPADQRKMTGSTAFRTFSIAGGANGEDARNGGWEYYAAQIYGDIKQPATKYVFVEEMDTRGRNVGSWQMHPRSRQWVDPVAMWHNKRSTIGFADGHAEMHDWKDKSFIEWNERAMYTPNSFSFSMTPPAGEYEDVEYMAERMPYKTLN